MQTKSSLPCFALISNIIRNTLGDFMWKYRWNIRFKKYGISNQPNGCIFDDPCLSTFGHSRSVSDKPQTMSGLSGVPNGTSS